MSLTCLVFVALKIQWIFFWQLRWSGERELKIQSFLSLINKVPVVTRYQNRVHLNLKSTVPRDFQQKLIIVFFCGARVVYVNLPWCLRQWGSQDRHKNLSFIK